MDSIFKKIGEIFICELRTNELLIEVGDVFFEFSCESRDAIKSLI